MQHCTCAHVKIAVGGAAVGVGAEQWRFLSLKWHCCLVKCMPICSVVIELLMSLARHERSRVHGGMLLDSSMLVTLL
jgi:hypothetical protein